MWYFISLIGVMKQRDLDINVSVDILDIPTLKKKFKDGECISYFVVKWGMTINSFCFKFLNKVGWKFVRLKFLRGKMFAASTYEEIVQIERNIENREIVVFLFVRPTNPDAMNIINEFEYIHYNAAKYCSVYAIGYTDNPEKKSDPSYRPVLGIDGHEWMYSTKAFVDFKSNLEGRIKWKYSGEIEILVLQNNPDKSQILDFSNYVAIDVNKGLREGYIDSFQAFMESLVRSAKSQVTAKEVIDNVRKSKLSIKTAISMAITDCIKIPKPTQEIIRDRLFYRCANMFN